MISKHTLLATILVTIPTLCSQPMQAQERIKNLSIDALGKPATTWFDHKSCKSSSGDNLYISVGSTTLKVSLSSVRGAVPGKIRQMTRDPSGGMTMQVPANVGCSESPLSISTIRLSPLQAVDAGAIVLSLSPEGPNPLDAQLAKIRDTGSCPAIMSGLVFCQGNRSAGEVREQVAYLIASDPTLVQKSGGPLRARCLFRDDKPFCNVIDDVEGEVRYELPIVGKPDIAAITQAHAKARAYVDSLRVKSR